MKLIHWPLKSGLLHLVQPGGDRAGPSPPSALVLTVPNVTAHPSTAIVPITVLLYNGPFLCGFNVPIKGLTKQHKLTAIIQSRRLTLFGHMRMDDNADAKRILLASPPAD